MNKFTTTAVTAVLATAACAASLLLAVAPAWVPQHAHDGLRVVELPRVVVSAAREPVASAPAVVQLPRVVVSGRRDAAPARATAEAPRPARVASATGGMQPVLQRQPS